MKAMVVTEYGGPDVVVQQDLPTPVPGKGEVLIKVAAAGVTTGDWRMRAAAFPGGFSVIGRLMFGFRAPRDPVLGGDVAGTIAAVGAGVTEFKPGDRVYGFSSTGAHAEYVVMKADGPVVPLPDGLSFQDGAALPFGMLAAYSFLKRYADLRAGERVLVIGGSGGTGVYAIQVARWIGAHVTAVASAENHDLLRDLGAEAVLDYRTEDPLAGGPYDVVFDTVGATRWAKARRVLKPGGRYAPLNFAIWHIVPSLLSRLGRRRFIVAVNDDRKADLETLAEPLAKGAIRPVIDRVLPFGDIRGAYAHVEGRHRKGAVVLDMAPGVAAAA